MVGIVRLKDLPLLLLQRLHGEHGLVQTGERRHCSVSETTGEEVKAAFEG